MRRVTLLVAVLLVVGASVAYAATTVAPHRTLAVSPVHGDRHTVFRVHAVPSPAAVEEQPLYYVATVALVGAHPSGCVFTRTSRTAADSLTAVLQTGTSAKAWCLGLFRGTVYAVVRQRCGPVIAGGEGAAEACPLTADRRAHLTGGPVGVSGTVTGTTATTATTPSETGTTVTSPVITSPPGVSSQVAVGTFSFRVL